MTETKVTDEHLLKVCALGQGKRCCSFLLHGKVGWHCAKTTELEPVLAQRREAGQMVAKGDNCSGPPDFQPIS